MEICVIGTGYVGLVAGVCFADSGHHVVCVDRDAAKITALKSGRTPIYEPGLEELMRHASARLTFTTDLAAAIPQSKVIFVAVGTPEKDDGDADLGPTLEVIKEICSLAEQDKVLVLKSTVPVGTAKEVRAFIKKNCKYSIDIVSNPEFLREGQAIDDFLRPDRIVIGRESTSAEKLMRELYEPFLKNNNQILFMDNASAEMTKYAANAFLSVKISFINELANLADKMGADINEVRRGFTSDSRINPAFFYPGLGFGGSCFPKDVKALVHSGKKVGLPMDVVRAADSANDRQKLILFEKMRAHLGNLSGLKIAVWGLSFKPRTDDVRESPALYLIEKLVEAGATVTAFDPIAGQTAVAACKVSFHSTDSSMDALNNCDALCIATEWNEFLFPDLAEMKKRMKRPMIFDGRNVLDPQKMAAAGFDYHCIGRQILARIQA